MNLEVGLTFMDLFVLRPILAGGRSSIRILERERLHGYKSTN